MWQLHFPVKVGPEITPARLAASVQAVSPVPGRKDVTLRKLDIKVETVNREPLTMHSDREDDTASVSTATRVMKAIYSVRGLPCPGPSPPHTPGTAPPPPSSLITTVPRSSLGQLALVQTHAYAHVFTHAHVHMHTCSHTLQVISRQQRLGRCRPPRLPLPPPFPAVSKLKPLEFFTSNCLMAGSLRGATSEPRSRCALVTEL